MRLLNKCDCIVDVGLLERAIMWYSECAPTYKDISIFLAGGGDRYPTVKINKKFVYVHRLIAMYVQREIISSTLVCHHIDGNTLNASAENIEVISMADHAMMHLTGRVLPDETVQKISNSQRGRIFTPEHRKRLSESGKGRVFSEEHKRNLRKPKRKKQ